MFVKAGWGLAGGVLLLLTIFGQRVFPVGGSTAAGIGVLYGARGVGAAMGPIALRWILGQQPRTLRRAIGPAYFIVGVFYIALSWAPTLPIAALCVLCAHFGGSILWVFSTVLLQLEVPDRFRGRVFAAELALVTLLSSISSYLDGLRTRPRRVVATPDGLCTRGAVRHTGNVVAADDVEMEGICAGRGALLDAFGRRGGPGGPNRLGLAGILADVSVRWLFQFLHRALHQLLGIFHLLEHHRNVHFGRARKPFATAVDAMLTNQRERVGQQVQGDGESAARTAHHRFVDLERIPVFVED